MPRGKPITDEKADAFLEQLAEGHTIQHAAKAVGIGDSAMYDRRQRDETFAARWAHAEELGVQTLEQEARRRAVEGSDTLLIFLLKAKRPAAYRDNVKVEHAGSIGHAEVEEARDQLNTRTDDLAERRRSRRAVGGANG